MSAPRLVTRCPACRTAFRLVADQLRLRQGLVRCGQCETVFDAREHLVELPAAGPAAVKASAPAPLPTPAADFDPGYDVPALDAPTMMMGEAHTEPEPAVTDEPGLPAPAADEAQAPHPDTPAAANAPVAPAWPALTNPDHEPDHEPEPKPEPTPAIHADAVAADASPSAPIWPTLNHDALEAEAPRTIWIAPGSGRVEPSLHSEVRHDAVQATAQPVFGHGDAATEPSLGHVDAPTDAHTDASAAPFADTASAVASEQVTRRWTRADTQTGPAFEPDFLRHTRERERPRKHSEPDKKPRSLRGWLWALAIVLLVAALAQGTYLARSQLAGKFPALRPLLEAACAPLNCEVPPWRDLDALRIETSQLQRQDEGGDQYVLAVTLRNQGRATTALPAIELVMTDLQDQLLTRRVLQPADYLEASQRGFAHTGMRAGTELPLRVRFRTEQAAANYRVLLFYP
jgi:predicted Zn finger-like uncharacterized protein